MGNDIQLFKQYTPLLDEVYKAATLTGDIDGDNGDVREGASAGEIVIPKLSMDGLKNYSRNGGYLGGDITLTHETVACNFDRGTMFMVDSMDNIETAGVAFGKLAGEFIRTKVVPELDAFRFSTYASADGIGTGSGEIETGEDLIAAISKGSTEMDEAEVPTTGRYLYITPTLYTLILNLDYTKSRSILDKFEKIIEVPQTRFYTEIEQYSDASEGTKKSGYGKAATGENLNFLIVHKDAVVQFNKHVDLKVVTPQQNNAADAWKFGYRNVSIAEVYENKLAGIYAHSAGKDSFVAVTSITEVPASGTKGVDITLTGTVAPANATNKTIAWSVKSAGTTGATIDGDELSTTDAGTVTVTATITNGTAVGTPFVKDFEIVIAEA